MPIRSPKPAYAARLTLLALACHAPVAFAAEHHGRVLFGGVPVPGATVTAVHGASTLSTVTDSQGVFQFADLPDGEWKLRVDLQGFAPAE